MGWLFEKVFEKVFEKTTGGISSKKLQNTAVGSYIGGKSYKEGSYEREVIREFKKSDV